MKDVSSMLALTRNHRENSVEFLKLLDYHIRYDISPHGDKTPLDITSEDCKELYWNIFEYVANTHNPEPMKLVDLNKYWDEICETLDVPADINSNPYILRVEITADGLFIQFNCKSF